MSFVLPYQAAETRLHREDGYGVTPGSPAWKRLNGMGIRLGAQVEIDPFAPPGAMVPTIPLINDDFSEGEIEGRVDFNGLGWPLSSLFGPPTVTSLGGGPTAYQWDWTWNGRRPARPASFGVHYGYPDSAEFATGFIFNALTINGGRADGFEISGDGFGKAMTAGVAMGGIVKEVQTLTETGTITSGNWTITIVEIGETTATIVYNGATAVIQAAIDALPSIEPGDIVVGGGPVDTTPVTLAYGGQFAGRNVAQATVNSASLVGGTVTPTTTTPGSDGVTDIPAVPAGAVLGNVYLDSTWAGLGTTQLLYCYEMELAIGERMARTRPINRTKSSDGIIDVGDQEHTLALTLGRNAVADAQLAKLRAGTRSFARVDWVGDVISGANNYMFRVDTSLFYQSVGMPEDTDEVMTREYEGRLAIDPVSSNVIAVRLVNGINGLA